jgi:tetratricopeptide (TPR) repeat protein
VARQRRAKTRSVAARRAKPIGTGRSPQPKPVAASPAPERPPVPEKKSSYLEAVGVYERGVEALQRRDYASAAERFREVLQRYPEERELHERARLYLRVCERELQHAAPQPQTAEERIFAATLALNANANEEARGHLIRALADDPDNGNAHYMLAAVCARQGDHVEAIAHLRQAAELDPEVRALARRDADFDSLHDDEQFRQIVERPPVPGAVRRRPRHRSAR